MKGKRIVIAINGSPASDAAVEKGLELASALGFSVLFVHAASPLAEDFYRELAANVDRENYFEGPSVDETVARDAVLAAAGARASQAGVDFGVELIGRDPALTPEGHSAFIAATIAGIAEGLDAALIFVGSRGRGPVAAAVLGSVSHNLINFGTVPVVVVHASEDKEKEPAGASSSSAGIRPSFSSRSGS